MGEVDYSEVLDGTVDEVKDAIRDLEDPDYEELLEAEKDGKDRKTVKEFIESQMDDESGVEEEDDVAIVEDIEEETSGSLLSSFSSGSLLVAGVILGLAIGYGASGITGTGSGATADADLVRQSVQTIAGQDGANVTEPQVKHSMYNMNVSTNVETENGTIERNQEIYVTLDGEKMFLVRKQLGQTVMPIDVDQAVRRAQAASQQQANPDGENATQ